MAGYSGLQVFEIIRKLSEQHLDDLSKTVSKFERIRVIAQEHVDMNCECSAALMILEVLDRG